MTYVWAESEGTVAESEDCFALRHYSFDFRDCLDGVDAAFAEVFLT